MGRPLALVTGASSGIGLDLAGAFARAGYDVALVANTPLARQRELAAGIVASLDASTVPAPRVAGYECDVADQGLSATLPR